MGDRTVVVKFLGETTGLKSSLGEVSHESEKAHSGLMGLVGGTAALAGGFAVIAGGAELLHESAAAASEDQTAMAKLNQAWIDTNQHGAGLQQTLKGLQEQGNQLGFSTADVTTTYASLTEAGLNQKQVMEALPSIYDLARAKGIDLATATKAVIMGMQGQGKALKDLNVLMPPAVSQTKAIESAQAAYNKAVADHGEKSKQAIAAMQKLQEVQANAAGGTQNLSQVLDILNQKVGGQAAAAAQTGAGGIAAFKAEVMDAGANILNAAMPAVSKILAVLGPVIVTLLNDLMPVITKLLNTFGPLIDQLMKGLEPAFKAIVPAVNTILGVLGPLISKLVTALMPAFNDLVKAIAPVIAQLVTALAPVLGDVMKALGPLLDALIKLFVPVLQIIVPILTPICDVLDKTLVPLLNVLTNVVNGIGPVLQNFGKVFGDTFGHIKDVAQGVWDFFQSAISTVGGVFKRIGDAISAPFKAAFDLIADIWNNTLGRFQFTIPGWVPGIGGDSFGFPQIPKFHDGGVVPGLPGEDVPIIAQAGETVIPAGRQVSGGAATQIINVNIPVQTQANPQSISRAVVSGLRTRALRVA